MISRYMTDEQRSQTGWIGAQKWEVILGWALRARIDCREDGLEEDTPLAFTVSEKGSIHTSRSLTADLVARIESWQAGSEALSNVPPLPGDLSLPKIGEVTSEPPRSAISSTRVIQTLIFVSAVAVLSGMLMGLGFSLSNSGGWYALLTAILSAGFQLLPIRLYREPT